MRYFLLAALLMVPFPAPADAPAPDVAVKRAVPDFEPAGSPFLLKRTDARAVVTGPVAHVVVTQSWENPNSFPVDGLYIFPLPENAAVNDMQLVIGDRTVRAEMRRREEARQIYEQARREGRVAGLLDQERPNIFAQRVANIMPGQAIQVVLAFDHEIRCEGGDCEYVFPSVVGPRFIPAGQADPGEIAPPVVEDGRSTRHVLALTVEVDAGVPIRDVTSPSHRTVISRDEDARVRAVLAEGETARLDRDFKLRWRVGGNAPEIGLLAWRDTEESGAAGAFTLILQPPADEAAEAAAPRELVFVLDCSGSMRGVPLDAAKNVVRRALDSVRPGDTFQIIRFSESASGLGPEPLAATEENIHLALGYLDSLHGGGGTHMLSGIRAALDRPADPDRLRIVAFLTDGYIGNEDEIFAEIRRNLGGARLFSFGIGRGASAFLGPRETPDEMVRRFARRIDTPVLTDIRITWEDLEVQDLEPARIPDLFAGQALLLHGRYTRPGTGVVVVEGRRGGRYETFRKVAILTELETDHEAIGRLWARARIHRLSRELRDGPREDVQEKIVALGLEHRLVTRWTSLVAVDSEIANRTGEAREIAVPVEMPEDVSYEGVFGKKGRGKVQMAYAAPASSFAVSASGDASVAMRQPPPTREVGRLSLSKDEDETDKPAEAVDRRAGVSFTQITLHLDDGAFLVVEEDGEVWRVEQRRRTLVRALTAGELDQVRSLLGAAKSSGESASGGLIVETARGRKAYALPSADPALAQLVLLLEGWASPPRR